MADTKTTALTAATSWASGDLLYMVRDPAGTPVSRKITVDNILQNLVCAANTSLLKSTTGYSLTGSNASSMIDLAGTWNTTGTPTAFKMNMTDAASNASSMLMDLQIGGVTRFAVTKGASVTVGSSSVTGSISVLQSAGTAIAQLTGTSGFLGLHMAAGGLISWGSGAGLNGTQDLFLLRDAANTLALRNSTNAQAFNIYNTYTSGSVYERGFMRWVSNVLEIGTEHVGATLRKTRIISGAAGTNSFEFDGETFRFLYNGSVSASMTPYSHIFGTAGGQSNGFTLGSSTRNVMTVTSFDVKNIRVNLGGDTSSFPALKRSLTVLQARLADDSAFAPFAASTLALTAPTDSSVLSSTGYSLTGSNAQSMIDLAGTLNTTGSPAIIKVAMSNTASGASTKFLSFLAGASGTTEVFNVTKEGNVLCGQLSGTTIFCSSIRPNTLILGGLTDIFFERDAANTPALRNGVNAQALNIYNTYTSGSVYERGFMRWVSNVLEIGTEHTGASARALAFKINNTTRLTISTTGNLAATNNGYFGAPQTTNWWSSSKVLQVGHAALFNNGSSVTSAMSLSSNLHSTGGGPLYISNGFAAKYDQDSGQHIWYTAPSGAADGAVTFTERMRLTNGGLLEIDKTTEDAGFINFKATADADATSAISTLTTSGTVTHHIQVQINGVTAWIPCSTTDPS